MMLDSMQLFSMADRQMRWLAARQKAVASNMANLNTPNYWAQDLKPLDFKREFQAAAMTVTDPKHLQAPGVDPTVGRAANVRRPYETTIDGSGVVLEEQLAKEKDIRAANDLALAVYGKHIGMFKIALRSAQ